MSTWQRDWKEDWIDRIGLIVALTDTRFQELDKFKQDMSVLEPDKIDELKEAIRQRFTPSSYQKQESYTGCESATKSVEEVVRIGNNL